MYHLNQRNVKIKTTRSISCNITFEISFSLIQETKWISYKMCTHTHTNILVYVVEACSALDSHKIPLPQSSAFRTFKFFFRIIS